MEWFSSPTHTPFSLVELDPPFTVQDQGSLKAHFCSSNFSLCLWI